MAAATPVYHFEDLEMGPANVYWGDPAGSGEDAERFLGTMGNDLAITMGTTTSPLTGAQFGDIALNKVITGGSFRIAVPFKEINPDNIQMAFGNSEKYTGGVKFKPLVGKDLRSLAKPMRIVKLTGVAGGESTDPDDTIILYLVSPTDAEVVLTFAPTEQRVLMGTFEAWPDSAHDNAWGYMGTAPVVMTAREGEPAALPKAA